jgi:hypothetical protein
MGKRIMNVYIDDEIVQLCKARQINMSAAFRAVMRIELDLVKGNEIELLKTTNSKLSAELEKANYKIKVLEAENERNKRTGNRRIIPI